MSGRYFYSTLLSAAVGATAGGAAGFGGGYAIRERYFHGSDAFEHNELLLGGTTLLGIVVGIAIGVYLAQRSHSH